jgi:hypothetical protein
MDSTHGLVIAVGLLISGQVIVAQEAQELSRYRKYVLESARFTSARRRFRNCRGERRTSVLAVHPPIRFATSHSRS